MTTGQATGAEKSCLDCPSFLSTNSEILAAFGKTTGANMCARYGHVLGRPKSTPQQNDKTLKLTAKNCPSFGERRPHRPEQQTFRVFTPDPDALEVLDELHPNKQACSACNMCKNFIKDEVVLDEHGWTAGGCAAKGKLILPDRRISEARACQYRQHGTPRSSLANIMMTPAFSDASTQMVNPVDGFLRGADSVVDPGDYESDLEVTPEDQKNGIRAWRKLVDPAGTGNEVYLPIFDPEFFDPEERSQIPQTDDDEHPELYLDHNGAVFKTAVIWLELDETPFLWGPPGVGKTEFARHMAWLMQLPFYRISITGTTELDDLAGKMRYSKEKGTYFQYGRFTKAWSSPCVVIVDEPNTGQPEVWEFLRPAMDNSKQLALDMNEGEIVARHDLTHLILAGNPAWNALNVGTNVISDADASRLMHVEFNLPEESIERSIIQNRVKSDGWIIDNVRLNFIMEVAKLLRELCEKGSLSITWGIRPQLKVARALAWFDAVTAYRLAIADMLNPEQQKIVIDQVEGKISTFPPIKRVEN